MGSCIGCCCYSVCCCECNFAIFPAPSPSYTNESNPFVRIFENSRGHKVPYLELLCSKPKMNIIYFHGNGQDLIYSHSFLAPIQEELNANIYTLEYPSYGTYDQTVPGRISNLIKDNALEFYDYLVNNKTPVVNSSNTVIIGRSIGSGGACYLASRKNLQHLVLISPFSTIRTVAQDFVGCLGKCLLKEHFNNIEEIENYKGRLLVIHGKMDEVIAFRHGKQVVNTYTQVLQGRRTSQQPNLMAKSEECLSEDRLVFVTPTQMSHNNFNFTVDILQPLSKFTQQISITPGRK